MSRIIGGAIFVLLSAATGVTMYIAPDISFWIFLVVLGLIFVLAALELGKAIRGSINPPPAPKKPRLGFNPDQEINFIIYYPEQEVDDTELHPKGQDEGD